MVKEKKITALSALANALPQVIQSELAFFIADAS